MFYKVKPSKCDLLCLLLSISLQILGKRGLLDLLGVRKTVGTEELFPPPRLLLEQTLQAKHQ